MSALKLTATASSVYVRTAIPSSGPKTKPALALLWSNRNILYHPQQGWRITPCAHGLYPAHDNPPSSKTLGFAFWVHRHKSPSFSFVRCSSSSSVEKSGVSGSGSSSSRSGFVTEMGSDLKDRDGSQNEALLQKKRLPPSVEDSQQHSKLLTLPTILTLGRVAAVPLLVASTLLFVASVWFLTAFIIWFSGFWCWGCSWLFLLSFGFLCWPSHSDWRVFGFVYWNLYFCYACLWYYIFLFSCKLLQGWTSL